MSPEQITKLPNWQWQEHSEKEIILTGQNMVDQTDFVWKLGEIAVIGFIYHSYTSPPWLWFVLAKGVTIRDLLDFRKLKDRIPSGTLTAVEADFSVGIRFAQFYGFDLCDIQKEYFGSSYEIMRKR